jgi:ceramide glucosyltransferase
LVYLHSLRLCNWRSLPVLFPFPKSPNITPSDQISSFRYYRQNPPRAAILSNDKAAIPHVTVIRPCKGREPYLYECLSSTFYQDYPKDKITVYFCISSRSDAAYPVLQKVARDHSDHHDCRIFIEEDEDLAPGQSYSRAQLGPNPKIRNMSRAYREAKGDLIWIIDCNIWVGRGVCGRMADKLSGTTSQGRTTTPYKLVHNLPISVDVDLYSTNAPTATATTSYDDTSTTPLLSVKPSSRLSKVTQYGGRLEELFLSSSHAKMYVAISAVAVAPCIVGKSNMFRKSHLDYLTSRLAVAEAKAQDPASNLDSAIVQARTGIDYFSYNICEDHLIGDLLWKSPLPPIFPSKMRNHGLVYGDLAIQPVAGMTVGNYIARRVRWLRVRKFTVPVATLVEPGTESFLCSLYGAWGATTSSYTRDAFGASWGWFAFWWVVAIVVWASVDWTVYLLLHSGKTVEVSISNNSNGNSSSSDSREGGNEDIRVPAFAKPLHPDKLSRRPFTTWLVSWLGREALAFPIWTWAIWGGVSVTWRDRRFWVGMDMKVHEIRDKGETTTQEMNGRIPLLHGSGSDGDTSTRTSGEPAANGVAVMNGKKKKRTD